MQERLCFDIDHGLEARQLNLEEDKAAIAGLGRRCVDYLRLAHETPLDLADVPRVFLGMLRPTRVPAERSYVLGIYSKEGMYRATEAQRLIGVLYFLHPMLRPGMWFITLLLLEPAARGKGIGAAVHDGFKRWAGERGARRLLVAVSDKNPRALRFWRDRMEYRDTDSITWKYVAVGRKHRELEYRLDDERVSTAW